MGDWLRVLGAGDAERIDVNGERVIGRGEPGLGMLAADNELSRRHARFTLTGDGELVVEDLGSSNGTFVNAERVSGPTPLRPGDVLSLGGTQLEVIGDRPTRVDPERREAGVTRVHGIPVEASTRVGRPAPAPKAPAPSPAAPPPSPAFDPPAVVARTRSPAPAGGSSPRSRDPRVLLLAGLLVLALAALALFLLLGV